MYRIFLLLSLLLSSLELSDTQVVEPHMRALLGIASYFCEAVVLELRTVPSLGETTRGKKTHQFNTLGPVKVRRVW